MPSTLVTPISQANRSYEKLDPRLAALLELDDRVFEPVDTPEAAAPVAGGTEGMRGVHGSPRARRQRRAGPLAFLTGPRRFSGTFEPVPRGGSEAVFSSVAVFVTARTPEALDSIALRAGGLEWRARAGRVGTTNVHPMALAAMEDDRDVVAVEWTGGAKPKAVAAERRGVSPRPAVGLAAGAAARGEGVVIGIVDGEGIDLYHPAFSTETGASRIAALWDHALAPAPGGAGEVPWPYGYGMVYAPIDLLMELDGNNRDRGSVVPHAPLKLSHGTMVAGVAAGGEGEDPQLTGVAPAADLVFVSTWASGAGSLAAMTEIAEAVDFVFREAGERPCVVNLSLGDELGPRDGTSPVERFLDALIAEKPGRAVVVAAGNEQEAGTHASGVAGPADRPVTVVCEARRPSARHAVIEIWYPGVPDGEAGVSVQIESPDGEHATPVIAPDGLGRAFDLGGTRLIVASVRRYPGNGDALIRVEMFPRTAEGVMDRGEYKLRLIGDGVRRPFHAWLDHTSFKLRADGEGGGDAEKETEKEREASRPITLTSPATCRSAVTVGACHHDTGRQACFTGRGPDRSGADKPEVYACGVTVRAPAAAVVARSYDTFTGTSAAAPLVTGAIALAFEHARRRGVRLGAEQTRAFVRAASAGEGRRLLLPPDGHLDGLFAAAGIELDEGATAPPERNDSALSRDDRAAPVSTEREKEKEGATMTAQNTKSQDLVREKDGMQLGIGYFNIRQNGVQTGRVLVLEEGNQMVEHWDLWKGFRQPSWANAHQEIMLDYLGEPIGLTEFTSRIAANSTYIVARCEQVLGGKTG